VQVQQMMGGAYQYHNGWHALRTLMRHEGMRGLFQVGAPSAPSSFPERSKNGVHFGGEVLAYTGDQTCHVPRVS
jgi:hypothetical protein